MKSVQVAHADLLPIGAPTAGLVAPELALLTRIAAPARPSADARIAAFEALPLGALIVDSDGVISACNKAAADLAGAGAQALIGLPWWRLFSPAQGVEPGAVTSRFTLHGTLGDELIALHRVPLGAGDAATSVLFLLEEVRDDEAAAPAEPAVDSFLLEVAHDLRSLLLSFNMALGGLADGVRPAEDDGRRLITALQRSTVHLQALLENMLDAASLDASAFSLVRSDLSLTEVLCEAVQVVDPLLGPKGLRIAADLPGSPLSLTADGQRIRQVVVNLLHNAIKYGPRNQTIEVRAGYAGPDIWVEVADHGPGIAPDEQPRLFDRFYRGRVAQRGEQGNGLGLAVARAIIDAHGGKIGVRSAIGEGATFWFTLPAD